MLAHFSFNLVSIVVYFVSNQEGVDLGDKGAVDQMAVPLSWALISGISIIACMHFYLNSRASTPQDTI